MSHWGEKIVPWTLDIYDALWIHKPNFYINTALFPFCFEMWNTGKVMLTTALQEGDTGSEGIYDKAIRVLNCILFGTTSFPWVDLILVFFLDYGWQRLISIKQLVFLISASGWMGTNTHSESGRSQNMPKAKEILAIWNQWRIRLPFCESWGKLRRVVTNLNLKYRADMCGQVLK